MNNVNTALQQQILNAVYLCKRKAVSQAKLIECCYISQNEREYYKNIRLEESKLELIK